MKPDRFALIVWLLCLSFVCLLPQGSLAQDSDEPEDPAPGINQGLVSGLRFRGLGPALMSGRISDIAVDPEVSSTWYVTAASGGVWKTTNSGTTWQPIFENYGSYSIGCVTIDPNNRHTVWVGTGENNSQRSVGYGDGLYKSIDGGKSFRKVGLDDSQHIAKIIVHPKKSDTVFVASQGPLWNSGGDRGVFKTTDGGKTWKNVLTISENTGVTDMVMDPRDPNTLYAASYQRRRHVWTLINGGPESGFYKSTDGGETWRQIRSGLPSADIGRIGLAISPIKPDVLYAVIEAAMDQGGFFRSTDRGETWSKVGSYVTGSPQYYQEIVADPHQFDRVYALDTYMMVSNDGGATFEQLGEQWKHVDNHALVIDPNDPNHLLIGCDGGLYETWDRGQNYDFKANLPLTQFYKIAVSNDKPFYYVYGGTQDNATQGGPTRTTHVHGIRNSDWFITVFGDGFDPAVDPEDPNIVYSQWQYGGLVRYDRKVGHAVDIKPQEDKGGAPLRWNWDSALLISPHDPARIYYASQILFRSDDRGDSWNAISPDLTRNMDRNQLKVMGRVWGVDTVAKNASTSFYGTIVALDESPLVDGLLYVGTDDGLVQVSEDGGSNWRKIETFERTDVPEYAYVNDIEASLHDPNTVYVALNNHKRGDFKPYIVMSTDRGQTWSSISGNLPEKGSVYTLKQDHVNPDLLFCGTEFGVYFTIDGGKKWIELGGGLPTIGVREIEIQRRENDLVLGTFGRGFYVLDDYSPLRHLSDEMLEKSATIFPIKKALVFDETAPFAVGEKAFQGASFFTAPNPPNGATFTYYLKDSPQTSKATRQARERGVNQRGGDVPYPSWDELKAEDLEESPFALMTIRDSSGNIVRRMRTPARKGIHRVTWDCQVETSFSMRGMRPMALPGTYSVSLEQWNDGEWTELVEATSFEIEPLGFAELSADEREQTLEFQRETADFMRVVSGTTTAANAAADRLSAMRGVIEQSPNADIKMLDEVIAMQQKLQDLLEVISGDPTRSSRNEPAYPGLNSRVFSVLRGHWTTPFSPTQTHRRNLEIAKEEFETVYGDLKKLIEKELPQLEKKLANTGAAWTPGQGVPEWKK